MITRCDKGWRVGNDKGEDPYGRKHLPGDLYIHRKFYFNFEVLGPSEIMDVGVGVHLHWVGTRWTPTSWVVVYTDKSVDGGEDRPSQRFRL